MAATEIQTVISEAGTTLFVIGDLDPASVDDFDRAVAAAIALDPPKLIIDIDASTFIDSCGAASMIRAMKASRAAGVAFVVRRPGEQALRRINQMGLAPYFGLGEVPVD